MARKVLSSYDDKRWLADEGIHTRPFGWESIRDVYEISWKALILAVLSLQSFKYY